MFELTYLPTKPRTRFNTKKKNAGDYDIFLWMIQAGEDTNGFLAVVDKDGNTLVDIKFNNIHAMQNLYDNLLTPENTNKIMAQLKMMYSP